MISQTSFEFAMSQALGVYIFVCCFASRVKTGFESCPVAMKLFKILFLFIFSTFDIELCKNSSKTSFCLLLRVCERRQCRSRKNSPWWHWLAGIRDVSVKISTWRHPKHSFWYFRAGFFRFIRKHLKRGEREKASVALFRKTGRRSERPYMEVIIIMCRNIAIE